MVRKRKDDSASELQSENMRLRFMIDELRAQNAELRMLLEHAWRAADRYEALFKRACQQHA